MLDKKKQLFLFTVDFPYGNYEISFLPQEVEVLSGYFEKIILVPLNPGKTVLVQLPSNVKVLNIHLKEKKATRAPGDYLYSLSRLFREWRRTKNNRIISNFKYHLSELLKFSAMANSIKEADDFQESELAGSIFYTYWMDEWTSALAILKERYLKNIVLVSRAHGFDLYDQRSSKGYIFPRFLQISSLEKIVSISKDGALYLISRFPYAKNKISCSRLGIRQPDLNTSPVRNEFLLVVSCSAIIDLKRVHKIAEILKYSTVKIRWVHFGDGPLRSELEEEAAKLPENVQCDFRGNTDNQLIQEFYRDNYINWFINVSKYEGIPVSIMEAISFGIPVIGTNVGGVKEIINETTGILINEDFNPKEVANLIETHSFAATERRSILDFSRSQYNAEVNYASFATELLQLNKN